LADAACAASQLEQQLARAKRSYTDAMNLLDAISRDIHERRQAQQRGAPEPATMRALDSAATAGDEPDLV
jgi:hypothetical protein